jgi:hypothetical protein
MITMAPYTPCRPEKGRGRSEHAAVDHPQPLGVSMNYLAHFSFFRREEDRGGYFTMVVSAAEPDEAVEKFEKEILRLKKESDAFEDVVEVYIDDFIEIEEMPKQAVLTRMESEDREGFTESINLLTEQVGLTVYGWCPEGKEEEYEEEEHDVYPFLVLDED